MNALFQISLFGDAEAVKISESPDDPHRHDYEELVIGVEGCMEHFIDFESSILRAPYLCYITKGKVHRFKPLPEYGKINVWVIRFISEFIPETTFQLYSNYHQHANLILENGACFDRMASICKLMEAEALPEIPDYAVLKHLLNALLAMAESERKKINPELTPVQKTQNQSFKNFLHLLEENFRRPLGVDFYAGKLFMSARNLNLICHHILQKSVTEIIESRKLTEAKNLLMNSGKTISEIGFELGYQEKTYFTSVFKKKTGQTPSEFREEMSKLIS